MVEEERARGVVADEPGRKVVDHQQPTGAEQSEGDRADDVSLVLVVAAVEEEELERAARRELLLPVADDELDVLEAV